LRAALAALLAALLPTSLARSVRLPLRDAAPRERGAARDCGRDVERDRELGLLEAGRLLEAGLPPEPVLRRDAWLRPDEDRLDELPLEPRREAARLVC
jgi:hypothetical protein